MEEKRRDLAGTPPPPASVAEAPPSEQPTSRRRGGAQKRKSTSLNSGGGGGSNPQASSSKRQAREKPPPVPFPPIHMNGPLTRARLQPYNSSSVADVAPVKREAEAREAAAKAEEMIRAAENWEALEAKIEAEYEAIKSRDANVHVVPLHAGWFSWTKIHPLEERMLPSFFNGKSESRTPEIYMEIRNWMLKKFHLNPSEQVELKNLSELTAGKLDARQEVLEFLDYWGLINYHPFPDQEPSAVLTVDAAIDADKDGAGKMESLVEQLFKFETVESCPPIVPRASTTVPAMSSGFFPESVIADELVKSEGPAVEYHCNSCSADCSRKRYHCQKQADFDLCADCFNNGKFGSHMSPSDFILMEPAEAGGASGGKWTDQETLLLLEAIELFRDNWSEIAEHVATKTRAQCILHFVQMPIEDAFFNHDDEDSDAPKENGLPVSTNSENSVPKADQDNDTAPKDVHENTEIQGSNTDNQDSSCPMEISKPDETGESDAKNDVGENFALKALKEAFEAVGSLPSPGKKMSFAEAGNPVMTLAAFLVRLVDPNTAIASVRNLLKSLSKNHSSEQLAARHCFLLEDPPEYKNLDNTEGAETEASDLEAQKDTIQNTESQKEPADSNSHSVRDDENDNNKESSAPEELDENKDSASKNQKTEASPSDQQKAEASKDPDKLAIPEEALPTSEGQPSSSALPKEETPKDTEKSIVDTELQSSTMKESEDGESAQEATQSKDPLKDVDMTSLPEKKEADLMVISNSLTDKENTGEGEGKEDAVEKKDPITPKNGLDVNDKLSRAALTAISAAAIKAKFLADQEEDQILQLSTFLIEKQLYKLESKLAFFNDMENIVMRVKDLLERSKQKLFHERAQIIATRFGMQASARPPNSQALPPNKAAVNFPNTRPFMGMNVLRPPISRPMVPMNPGSSVTMTGSETGITTMQPNADGLSSISMK
ncbi:DNA-binding family protein [Striga asiatica]|uniref:DNA-binding family protein n=1 Tax=Striga asiatica TaxID=4170 RepID=A0A5A7R1W4_STRAF|nr:DNA-binding family protein [Striga asiatica]